MARLVSLKNRWAGGVFLRRNRIAAAMIGLVGVAVLAACYVPDNFQSEVRLGPTGDFALTFIGELTWAPLVRDIRDNKIDPEQLPARIAELRGDLARDPNFKSIESLGNGRFKVLYEREGHLAASQLVTFVRRNEIILQIRATPDGLVTVSGTPLKPSDAEALTDLGLKVQGEFRVTTNALVKEQNATSTQPFGIYTIYKWKIDSVFSNSPRLVMQREGAWPAPTPH
jgi:hypothetical protein